MNLDIQIFIILVSFLKCASGNRALNFMGNFRETFGNFLETVRVVIGQESVRVGMWSRRIYGSQ